MKLEFTLFIKSTPEKIWNYYEDISLRKIWEVDLEEYNLYGDFVTGTEGNMKLTDLPAMDFVLLSVTKNKEFVDCTPTPFGDLVFGHEINEVTNGVEVTHSLELRNTHISEESLETLNSIFDDTTGAVYKIKQAVE
ncbi:polyketide cyclase [Enterococcus sp. AZ196]|uniref:polyketide cyclase n=1 Tax=Enterococcus sp. AZ196 TaxID=2774659 RepID=UPI003D2E709C